MNSARVEAGLPDGSTKDLKKETFDPLPGLWTPGGAHATVGISVGTQRDFGRVKVTAHVYLECDQHEKVMDRAAEQAFTKAVEFMTDGMKLMLAEENPG